MQNCLRANLTPTQFINFLKNILVNFSFILASYQNYFKQKKVCNVLLIKINSENSNALLKYILQKKSFDVI